jgi:mannose-6-phosphate isomerase-like protein (cupin superfamily)
MVSKTLAAYLCEGNRMPLALQIVGPDAARECRQFPLGQFEVFNIAGRMLGRAVYQPGWRWSQHVGAAFGAAWCPVEHVGFVLAGRAGVRMKDGTEAEMSAGDWFSIPAGHDSWVLGAQDYVSLHVVGAHAYATPAPASTTGKAARKTSPVSAATVKSCTWGDGCIGWTLLARPTLHVMEEQMAAGTQELPHLHPNTTQFYYVLDGEAIVEVGRSRVAAEAGQAVEIGVGDPHQIRNETDAALRLLVISSGSPRDDRQDLP